MFKTPYLKIDEHGIDLIKNYSVDQHIDYQEINEAILTRRFLLEKWRMTLIIGLTLVITSLVLGVWILSNWEIELGDPRLSRRGFPAYLITHLLLFTGGVFMVIASLKKSQGLLLRIANQQIWLPLSEIEKESRVDELIQFLKKRIELEIEH